MACTLESTGKSLLSGKPAQLLRSRYLLPHVDSTELDTPSILGVCDVNTEKDKNTINLPSLSSFPFLGDGSGTAAGWISRTTVGWEGGPLPHSSKSKAQCQEGLGLQPCHTVTLQLWEGHCVLGSRGQGHCVLGSRSVPPVTPPPPPSGDRATVCWDPGLSLLPLLHLDLQGTGPLCAGIQVCPSCHSSTSTFREQGHCVLGSRSVPPVTPPPSPSGDRATVCWDPGLSLLSLLHLHLQGTGPLCAGIQVCPSCHSSTFTFRGQGHCVLGSRSVPPVTPPPSRAQGHCVLGSRSVPPVTPPPPPSGDRATVCWDPGLSLLPLLHLDLQGTGPLCAGIQVCPSCHSSTSTFRGQGHCVLGSRSVPPATPPPSRGQGHCVLGIQVCPSCHSSTFQGTGPLCAGIQVCPSCHSLPLPPRAEGHYG
ncbi:uncharacterized protein LOC144257214 [Urocitellus parryii]